MKTQTNPRTLVTLCVTVSLLGCSRSSTESEPSAAPQDSHQRMLATLRDLHEQMAEEHRYFGTGELRNARRQLIVAKSTNNADGEAYWLEFIGREELQHGNTDEAIKYLQAYYDARKASAESLPAQAEANMLYNLAVAHLRKGETENCVHCQQGESCILPIRGNGVHTKRAGAEESIKYLSQVLERNPQDRPAIWLLNVAHMTLGSYPGGLPPEFLIAPEKFRPQADFPRFENVAASLRLDTLSLCGGTIADDFDGDGFLDIVVSDWKSDGQIRYFRNNGDGSFADRTEAANLTGVFGGLNVKQADYDNDGDLDVLVLRGAWLNERRLGGSDHEPDGFRDGRHPNSLLQNDGSGRFKDVTFDAGLGDAHFPTQTAEWADYDNDGDLDLFIGNEFFSSQLFENDGKGRFADVAERAGVTNDRWSKGVTWGDYNGDRFPDLYVSNLDGKNRLYRNNTDGTFTDVADTLNVVGPKDSFPVWFWDFDNDGVLDLYVASYPMKVDYIAADYLDEEHDAEGDCLYRGNGQGEFVEVARDKNLIRVSQPMGSNFGDLDNDGFLDFYLGTGYPDYDALMPNLMYRNMGGTGFSDVTIEGGFGHLQKGHGVAFADFDHDGDQDVFIEMGGSLAGDAFQNALFENPGFGNNWIKIRLVGRKSNRSAIGARIRIVVDAAGGERSVFKWVNSGGSFGANPLRQEIGLGDAPVVKRLEVFWPTTDETQVFENVAVNQLIEIEELADGYKTIPLTPAPFNE